MSLVLKLLWYAKSFFLTIIVILLFSSHMNLRRQLEKAHAQLNAGEFPKSGKIARSERVLRSALKIKGVHWGEYNIKFIAKVLASAWQRNNIRPKYIVGVWMHESQLNPGAFNRNWNGTIDVGLGQINSCNFDRFHYLVNKFVLESDIEICNISRLSRNYWDVKYNALASVSYLCFLKGRYKKWSNVLTAYYSGYPKYLYGIYLYYYNSVMSKVGLITA